MKKKKPTRREKQCSVRIKQIGQFDGYNGVRKIFQFSDPTNVILSHSCLLPKFTITFRVGQLRRLTKNLNDDECLSVTVSAQSDQFTFVR